MNAEGSACVTLRFRAENIRANANSDARIAATLDLADYVDAHIDCGRYHDVVDDIAALLDDDAEGVRSTAARILGDIGKNAQRAVPALVRAMKRSDAINDADPSTLRPVNDSGAVARNALRRISGHDLPAYSDRPSKPPVAIEKCVVGQPCAVWAKLISTHNAEFVEDKTGCIVVAFADREDGLASHFVGVAGVVYKIPTGGMREVYKIMGRTIKASVCQSGVAMYVDAIYEIPDTYKR
jgi:hypothetical protein